MAAALVLSTLSFAAGVAGDLSLTDPPNYGTRVVLRIPPEIPSDAPRAAPLRPLISTSAAEAVQPVRHARARFVRPVAPIAEAHLVKARHEVSEAPKLDPDRAPKPEEI